MAISEQAIDAALKRGQDLAKAEHRAIGARLDAARGRLVIKFDNGVEMKDAVFSLYLANNAARTPVLIEAVIPVATARVELVKASGK